MLAKSAASKLSTCLLSRFLRGLAVVDGGPVQGDSEFGYPGYSAKGAILMILPNDPLREAILTELNQAIFARRAQGVSFDALGLEYGLSEEAMHLILRRNDRNLDKRMARAGLRHRPKARVV